MVAWLDKVYKLRTKDGNFFACKRNIGKIFRNNLFLSSGHMTFECFHNLNILSNVKN